MITAFILALAVPRQVSITKLDLILADKVCGTNTFSQEAGTKFVSETTGKIQGYDLKSHVRVELKNEKPVSLEFEESLSMGGKVMQGSTMKVANGRATIHVEGKKDDRTISVELAWPMMGNFHPQFLKFLAKKVRWSEKSAQTLDLYVLEALNGLKPTITPEEVRSIKVDGQTINVRYAKFKLAALEAKFAFSPTDDLLGMDVPTQKLRFAVPGLADLFADPMAKYPELSSQKYADVVTEEVSVPMRDRKNLKATVIRPKGEGAFPTILSRTPYNRKMATSEEEFYAKRGYAYIVQDVRGTGESEGAWDPFVNERKDGYDTIDWIAKQTWSDKKVGMIGGSYGGLVQWSSAVERHSALKCIVPQVSPPASAMWNLPYENGVFTLYPNLWWLRIVDNPKGQDMFTIMAPMKAPKNLLNLPLSRVDEGVMGFQSKIFEQWLKREGESKWDGWNYEKELAKVNIPALHISGWFDGDEIGTQRNWAAMRKAGRKNQWLIYGPWTHAFNTTSSLGEVNFGKDAILELDSLYLRWFDTWLKGKKVGLEKISKTKFFVMGANKWVESSDWPPKESKRKLLYFDLDSPAKGIKRKGHLVEKASETSLSEYTYDPSKVKLAAEFVDPSKAGETSLKTTLAKLEKDAIILHSDPMKKNTAICGPFDVEFDFRTSAKDTDFYTTIFDMAPSGNYWYIAQTGKLKASYIQGLDKMRALTPGKTYRAKLKIWDSAHELKKGHRLVVVINSDCFPITSRNLGKAEPIFSGTRMVTQRNTLKSSPDSPAFLSYQVLWEK